MVTFNDTLNKYFEIENLISKFLCCFPHVSSCTYSKTYVRKKYKYCIEIPQSTSMFHYYLTTKYRTLVWLWVIPTNPFLLFVLLSYTNNTLSIATYTNTNGQSNKSAIKTHHSKNDMHENKTDSLFKVNNLSTFDYRKHNK